MKIVINTCFGGFGLSYKAMMLFAKLKGIKKLYAYINKETDFKTYVPYDGKSRAFCIHYSTEPLKDGKIPDDAYFSAYSVPRNDPKLVEVVEKLGKAANGNCANLAIVDIPDGVDWEIDEYDGNEHVDEVHRSWR